MSPAAVPPPTVVTATAHPPRMVIHEMRLHNFKSYAGTQIIGPFHKSFSAVVGPNGSGKSNVIDAMLFVFGFRANKMRQGKLSELIHASQDMEDLDSCSVDIHFREIVDTDAVDGFEVVPNSDLIIRRTAYRNNTSKYFINDRSSNYTEVTTLLKGRGIDLDHKRFLILQGEVESISQMKPKAPSEHEDGLLEYLEDIIGTSKYKIPLKEKEEELEELSALRLEKLSRVKHVEKEKSALEERKQEAEAFLRAENELILLKGQLDQRILYDLALEARLAEEEHEQLKKVIDEDAETYRAELEMIEKLKRDCDASEKEFQKLRGLAEKATEVYRKYEREEIQLQEKRKHAKTRETKLNKSINTESHELSETVTRIKTLQNDIQKAEVDDVAFTAEIEQEEAVLAAITESLKGKTAPIAAKIEARQKKLSPFLAQLNEQKSALQLLQQQRELANEQAEASTNALKQVREELVQLMETLKHKKAELAQLQHDKKHAVSREVALVSEIDDLKKSANAAKETVLQRRSKVDEATTSINSSQQRSTVLDHLIRQRDSGRIRGIHDRLGNLGTIDDKYDVAVSTACGALNSIVVDTVAAGQQCLETLRRNSVGRAVIICLDKLQVGDMSPIQTPEGVPRLFDLIRPKDPKFAPAFFSGLHNTLVANDLEQANRIAYGAKRWRVVTLKGELIETSGTMSGGGSKPLRGGMSSKLTQEFRPEQVERMHQELVLSEEKLVEVTSAVKEKVEELEVIRKRIPELTMEIKKAEVDVQSLQKQIPVIENRVKELTTNAKVDDDAVNAVKKLDASIQTAEKKLTDLQVTVNDMESDIKLLQEEILEAGGVQLRSQNARVESIRERAAAAQERSIQADVARKSAERDRAKLEKSIESARHDLEKVLSDIQGYEDELAQLAASVSSAKNEMEEAQELATTKQEELGEVKRHLAESEESIRSVRLKEAERKNRLKDLERTLRDFQGRTDEVNSRLSKLCLHVFEEEEDENDEPNDGSIPSMANDELESFDKKHAKSRIADIEKSLKEMKPNLSVLAEYNQRHQEYLKRIGDLEVVTDKYRQGKDQLDALKQRRLDEFLVGFREISYKLKEMYQMITLGGNAELELVDSLDPFAEGIIFSVMPPRKSWKNIANLSGGEKTLSSLALVFALHHYKPTPLYVMDEIDAALDFRNVSIVANYIKERTRNAQFVIISLRNNMFELADRLVGIYKTENRTKSVAIDPRRVSLAAGLHG